MATIPGYYEKVAEMFAKAAESPFATGGLRGIWPEEKKKGDALILSSGQEMSYRRADGSVRDPNLIEINR